MKVQEKDADRKAEAHVLVEGQVAELPEYGEYIDKEDHAVCCFVPVEPRMKLKIGGRFHGTVHTIAYDAFVDGVLRRANSYKGKSVTRQNNKKLDVDRFLYKTEDGILETEIIATSIPSTVTVQENEPDTIGTLELRIYVLRQFGEEHTLQGVQTYLWSSDELEGDNSSTTGYTTIAPQFMMEYEKNCGQLDKSKSNREQRKCQELRPGRAPWVIFRFHYRSKESIKEKKLNMSFSPATRRKAEHRVLEIQEPFLLETGAKTPKIDETASSRADTPASTVPSTPIKGLKDGPKPKPVVSSNKQQPKSATPAPPEEEAPESPDSSPSPELSLATKVDEDLRARLFTKPTSKNLLQEDITMTAPVTPISAVDEKDFAGAGDKGHDIDDENSEQSFESPSNTNNNKMDTAKDTDVESIEQSIEKFIETMNQTCEVSGQTTVESYSATPIHSSSLFGNGTAPNGSAKSTEIMEKASQSTMTGAQKLVHAPAPTTQMLPTVAKDSAIVEQPITLTPTKRPSEFGIPKSPDLKRVKPSATTNGTPLPTAGPVPASRLPSSSSPGPNATSLERKLAEARKRVKEAKEKRQNIAKKQSVINEQLAPYQQHMADEIARLDRMAEEEEIARAEEEERLRESMGVLSEFQNPELGD
ncbi:hypothetical protein BDV95DRAFT_650561 [Massariosphaeria phaeospora]|uniref:Uncharacterized protein n=1 Tax=Massariosphaeria phaeospora TaxID=100035 RepID=A0A7C8MIQ1_9PLEO|nr:hypothetical protein BDV95DRAFT_650561 [Massariosphaeria phaeospora]